jgi:hypothetical protein
MVAKVQNDKDFDALLDSILSFVITCSVVKNKYRVVENCAIYSNI